MLKNYKAWGVGSGEFYALGSMQDRLKFLLNYAILAPSSHNTQPWLFRVKDGRIDIYADLSRKLKCSDPSGRMLYTAVGCAIENIKIAAAHYGLPVSIRYNDSLEAGGALPDHVAGLVFNDTNSADDYPAGDLFPALTSRSSSRGKYTDKQVPREAIDFLGKLNLNKEIRVDIISDTGLKSQIADLAGSAMKEKMASTKFRRELAHWLRTNTTPKGEGMPGSGHGMSFLISILAPFILRHKDVSDFEGRKAVLRVNNFPSICVLSSQNDNAFSWVKTGETLERFLLYIDMRGMAASIMAALIESKQAREGLRGFLFPKEGAGQAPLPQMFFGFGFASRKAPHSPRRKLEDVLT